MYEVSLDDVMFPVAPSRIETKISNKNNTTVLVDDGEINILKKAGLTEIRFDVLLPSVDYPFAQYEDGFKTAFYYLKHLEKLKVNQKPFIYKVIRKFPDGRMLFGYNMKVSLEEYTITDDVSNGFDIVVSIKLKQYRTYGTKIGTVTFDKVDENSIIQQEDNADTKDTELVEPQLEEPKPVRQEDNAPDKIGKSIVYYTTSGISMYELARKYYGNVIYEYLLEQANKNFIENGVIKNGYIPPNTAVVVPEKSIGYFNEYKDGDIIIEEPEKIYDTFLVHYVDGVPYL